MVGEEIQGIVRAHTGDGHGIDWDLDGLVKEVATIFPLAPAFNTSTLAQMKPKEIEDKLVKEAEALYEQREKELGSDNMRVLERLVMLRTMDNLWVEHLTNMEDMRHGIGLHAVAQRDPLVAYKREGHEMFQNLLASIRHDVARMIYHVNVVRREEPQKAPVGAQAAAGGSKKQHAKVGGKKVGRNDPCPCGSGKKYKHCCGK
jgi:preprotein translocase subunit SecA